MPKEKTIMIKPLVDISYGKDFHAKGSKPFSCEEMIAKRLVDGKKAEPVK